MVRRSSKGQNFLAQIFAGKPRRIAGHKSLARRGGLAGIARRIGVAHHLVDLATGNPTASAQICGRTVLEP